MTQDHAATRPTYCPRPLGLLAGALLAGMTSVPRPDARAADVPIEHGQGVHARLVASGLDQPVHVTSPPGDPRLFVVEQPGQIRVIENGRLLDRPFLDLTDRVRTGYERGLLSVAFHPHYATNGRLFVNYTDLAHGDTRVEQYQVSPDPNRADSASARLILTVRQPYANHNGGLVLFGPDGMLYIGMGDGGSGGDPHGNGQNLGTLLGKMLRIDVDRGSPYTIPPDNPFVHRAGARPEIWALGLRNPWRFCFDPVDGMLYIADVGQDRWEEIDVEPDRSGGLNYGWNVMEGEHCFRNPLCDRRGLVAPVLEYGHADGCSITGGLVYRGRRILQLWGQYFFSDYCDGWIQSVRVSGGRVEERRVWQLGEDLHVSSFGADSQGELYVVSHDGRVLEIVPDR